MAWRPLRLTERRGNRRSRIHLDESVPSHVEKRLAEHGYHATTTRAKRMARRSDEDQAAYAWRERRSIATFDYDFFDPSKLPQTRNPGVIVIDCDRSRDNEVRRARPRAVPVRAHRWTGETKDANHCETERRSVCLGQERSAFGTRCEVSILDVSSSGGLGGMSLRFRTSPSAGCIMRRPTA